jgi:probable F420-dependent oxidoreductase
LSTSPASAFRFAVANTPFANPEDAVDFAVRAERTGFDAFVMADLPGAVAPASTLSAVARATSTIRLGPFVLNTASSSPYLTVRELATLDRLSGGRLEIGLGSGIAHPGLDEELRTRAGARYARLQETVDALEGAWQDPDFTPGFQQRPPRLAIAVTGERALRLAARHADTFIVASVPPVPRVQLPRGEQIVPELEPTARQLDQLRAEAGERSSYLEIGVGAPVVITDDREAWAQERVKVHTYISPAGVLASPKVLVGTVEQIADRILEYRDRLGLTYYVFTRAQTPEELAPVIDLVRRKAGPVVA